MSTLSDMYDYYRSRYLFTLTVPKIEHQQESWKPVSENSTSVEGHFKRAIATIVVKNGKNEAQLTATIEFKGLGLTLSLTKGSCRVAEVGNRMAKDFFQKYHISVVRLTGKRKEGAICEYTLEDPEEFLGYLHLIHNRTELHVWSDEGEGLIETGLEPTE